MKLPKYVKKSFEGKERIWVKVVCQVAGGYLGTLANKPVVLTTVKYGEPVFVKHEDVVDSRFEGD